MNTERRGGVYLEIIKRLAESKPRRELAKFLIRQHDQEKTLFTSETINQWGKGAIGRAYAAGADWIQDLLTVGYVAPAGERDNGIYQLTENGKNFAMDILVEDEVQKMGILGDDFLSTTSGHDRSTLLNSRGSMAEGTKKVKTDRSEPDGWKAKHIND
jgi:hypothetical protein